MAKNPWDQDYPAEETGALPWEQDYSDKKDEKSFLESAKEFGRETVAGVRESLPLAGAMGGGLAGAAKGAAIGLPLAGPFGAAAGGLVGGIAGAMAGGAGGELLRVGGEALPVEYGGLGKAPSLEEAARRVSESGQEAGLGEVAGQGLGVALPPMVRAGGKVAGKAASLLAKVSPDAVQMMRERPREFLDLLKNYSDRTLSTSQKAREAFIKSRTAERKAMKEVTDEALRVGGDLPVSTRPQIHSALSFLKRQAPTKEGYGALTPKEIIAERNRLKDMYFTREERPLYTPVAPVYESTSVPANIAAKPEQVNVRFNPPPFRPSIAPPPRPMLTGPASGMPVEKGYRPNFTHQDPIITNADTYVEGAPIDRKSVEEVADLALSGYAPTGPVVTQRRSEPKRTVRDLLNATKWFDRQIGSGWQKVPSTDTPTDIIGQQYKSERGLNKKQVYEALKNIYPKLEEKSTEFARGAAHDPFLKGLKGRKSAETFVKNYPKASKGTREAVEARLPSDVVSDLTDQAIVGQQMQLEKPTDLQNLWKLSRFAPAVLGGTGSAYTGDPSWAIAGAVGSGLTSPALYRRALTREALARQALSPWLEPLVPRYFGQELYLNPEDNGK